MPWLMLAVAILFEIAGTTGLKLAGGLARPGWLAAAIALYAVAFVALAQALEAIPVGVAYAIWSGIGTAAIAAIGVVHFGEAMTAPKLLFIGLILVGVIGLNLSAEPR